MDRKEILKEIEIEAKLKGILLVHQTSFLNADLILLPHCLSMILINC